MDASQDGTVSDFSLAARTRNDHLGFKSADFVDAPTDRDYAFYTNSNDGSQLYIGSSLVVEPQALHKRYPQPG